MSEREHEGSERPSVDRDFLAEVEEIFDALAEHLRDLESALVRGAVKPGLVHVVFRQVHTLKGLAGMQERRDVVDVAHDLEEHLDRLRMGRARIDADAVDLIHATLGALGALIRGGGNGDSDPDHLEALRARLRAEGGSVERQETSRPLGGLPLDPELLKSLTEYEEHRLHVALGEQRLLSLIRVRFPIQECGAGLKELTQRLDAVAETITTIPLFEESTEGELAFVLLVATDDRDVLRHALEGRDVSIEPVERRATPKAEPEGTNRKAGSGASAASTLRVPISRLDGILEQVADLSVAMAVLQRAVRRASDSSPRGPEMQELQARARDMSPRLSALQRSAVEARLVAVGQAFSRLGIMVSRDARAARKDVDVEIIGSGTEIDKAVMDELGAPLLHLLRNAVDHGVEPPDEREASGKPRRARIVLSAAQRSGRVVIEVTDDGRGISLSGVRDAAVAAGRAPEDGKLSEEDVHELIFSPGLSTAPRVSQVSGRGVGLDIVRQSIRRLKGSIVVRSREGQGTAFVIDVPITLLLVQALIVSASGRRFAIPTGSIRENLRVDPNRLHSVGDREVYEHAQGEFPVLRLRDLLHGSGDSPRAEQDRFAVVAGPAGHPVGLLIEELVGHQEVMIKPLGRRIGELPGIVGATELGDATAVLVLDPERLAQEGGIGVRRCV
jgi:two-component system chemotaxis sensor kinase CheA